MVAQGYRWDSHVNAASRRFDVPADIIRAVLGVESGGDPRAISGKGAGGLMQIMPATYDELAAKHGLGPDRFDPANNIMGGAAYLRENYDRFGGDWDTALAAYNAGPGRVERGGPLPAETRNYVPKVRAGMQGSGMAGTMRWNGRASTAGMTEDDLTELARRGAMPAPGSGGLLNMAPELNYNDGLGGLLGTGQTPNQPPGPSVRSGGISSRIEDLIDELARPGERGDRMTGGAYGLAGMGAALQPLAATRDRKVGIGELIGAMGQGLSRGFGAADAAERQDRADQFGELGNLSRVQGMQRSEAAAQRQLQAANAYAAQIEKINPGLAAALRNNPALMDEIAKAQANQQFATDKQTPAMLNAAAMGLTPGTPAYNEFLEKHSGGGTNINLNTTENKVAGALGESRVKRYVDIREKGEAAPKMLGKLDQLETVLDELGSTGPATPTIAKLVGWARQAGVPTEQINAYYQQFTGQGLADPAKVDLAVKLTQDFVTSSIKSLGANPTDTDLLTLQQANPSITNQAEANRHIIRNTLRPQFEGDRDLWNEVRGLDRTDQTLNGLEDRIYQFQQKKQADQPKPQDSPKTAAPAAYPNARQAPDGNWYVPDPARPGKWASVKQ